jgi:histidine triad (HIT) family protein
MAQKPEDSVLGRIVSGQLPSYELGDFGKFKVILDIKRATEGHTLVLSKEPVEDWLGLSEIRVAQAAVLGQVVAQHLMGHLPHRPDRIIRVTSGVQVNWFHDMLVPSYQSLSPDEAPQHRDPVARLHPASGRMDEPTDHARLTKIHELVAFPDEKVERVAAYLEGMAVQMASL